MSFFKSKRSNDFKPSSKSNAESESKNQKQTSQTASSSTSPKPGEVQNSKANSKPNSPAKWAKERSLSVDMTQYLETESPADSKVKGTTDKAVSISRSGRFKAKGKTRARLFTDGSQDGAADQLESFGRASSTLSTPEDRQTVLQAVALTTGRNPSSKSADAAASSRSQDQKKSSKWSTTDHSTDL